jgi:membrane protease YdiL (CAAX protease family)
MPRVAAWLCVPALLMGIGAAIMLAVEHSPASGAASYGSIRQAAAAVTVVWTFPALALTPVAGILTLLISRKKQWAPGVVSVLWVLVVLSIGIVIPATNLALENYVYFQPRPAEAPPSKR